FGTWNVGTMTGRSGEVVEVLVRRRVDICCVQETRWKGSGVRMVKGRQGQKYKFVWQGCPEGVNGVGVLFSEEFVDSVVSVTRVSDRLMMVKIMIGKLLVNVISGYAPQVGRSDEEKDKFWCAIEKLMENVKDEEVVVVGGDLNGHVGRSMDGFEGVHGGYGYGVRNGEGERILEFADGADLLICNTQFQKEDNKLVTYTSGGSTTTVDYLMVRRRDRGHLRDTKAIPGEEAVLSTLVPLYKGKGDPLECGSYRAIKLLEHGMKVLERVLERRIRKKVKIDEMQFGFMPGRGTTDALFIVRQLQEKYMEKRKKLFLGFVDLEKAFDRVPRKVLTWALRKLGVEEWLIRVVMAMYKRARTAVRTKDGNSGEFEVKVGVHQGSVLSPLLFVAVMEVLAQNVKEGLPWELLYADDLVLISII
uniref:craniofacial development protein 2-like n=1 Tax=Myxine glutinosa TaxID=7769 RepID=UPI00358E0C29